MFTPNAEDQANYDVFTIQQTVAYAAKSVELYNAHREAGMEPDDAYAALDADFQALTEDEVVRLNTTHAYETDEEAFQHLYEGFSKQWHEELLTGYHALRENGWPHEHAVKKVQSVIRENPMYQIFAVLESIMGPVTISDETEE
jgi:hypothetical protein